MTAAPLSPVLRDLPAYPFVRLTQAKLAAAARGIELIDFGIGEPREETPAFIRAALAGAIEPLSTYPAADGLPELREAIAGWVQRRFGAALDPDTEVVPTYGSKEAVFHLAAVLGGDIVAVTEPGYPVPERGALFAGRQVHRLALRPENGWLPDPDELPDPERLALVWLNSPNNPTGAVAPPELLEEFADRARAGGFALACDEAYSELWFGAAPPPSGLAIGDRTNVIAFNTLSKRSSMPGYRSGFAAGDPALIAALKRYRPNVGSAPQTFVQRAAIAAWRDEEHVVEVRARYAAKREVMLAACAAAGLRSAGGDASFFLWLALPDGATSSEAYALDLLERTGIVVAPGAFFGPYGEGHVRLALVPSLADCERAAALLAA